jgi:uncharacterized protein YdeI (BOF family)
MSEPFDQPTAGRLKIKHRLTLALIGAGLLAVGGATGAVVMAETRPTVSMAPSTPVAIRSLSSGGIVTIRGKIAEIYGNKFIMGDGTGRALVDLGPEGEGRQLLTSGEAVTVQGRFDRGIVHAAFLIGAGGKVLALGPTAGPPQGPCPAHGRPDHGPRVSPALAADGGDSAVPTMPPAGGVADGAPAPVQVEAAR